MTSHRKIRVGGLCLVISLPVWGIVSACLVLGAGGPVRYELAGVAALVAAVSTVVSFVILVPEVVKPVSGDR